MKIVVTSVCPCLLQLGVLQAHVLSHTYTHTHACTSYIHIHTSRLMDTLWLLHYTCVVWLLMQLFSSLFWLCLVKKNLKYLNLKYSDHSFIFYCGWFCLQDLNIAQKHQTAKQTSSTLTAHQVSPRIRSITQQSDGRLSELETQPPSAQWLSIKVSRESMCDESRHNLQPCSSSVWGLKSQLWYRRRVFYQLQCITFGNDT